MSQSPNRAPIQDPDTDIRLYVVIAEGPNGYEPTSEPVPRLTAADLVRRHWGSGRHAWRFPLPPETRIA